MRFAIIICLFAVALLGVWFLPKWNTGALETTVYLQDGREFDQQQVKYLLNRFAESGINNPVIHRGKIQVPSRFRAECNRILGSSEFKQLSVKKANPEAGLSNPFMPPSEKARLAKRAKLQHLVNMLERIYGIREAEIVHDQLKSHHFSRHMIQTAAITLWAEEGETIRQGQASTARKIVCNAFAGLEESNVLVVDGDTCLAFNADPDNTNEMHTGSDAADANLLEADRQQLESQFQKILSKYGAPKVVVRMQQEKQKVSQPVALNKEEGAQTVDTSEAVANGTGSIRKKTKPAANTMMPPTKTVLVNRLLGIEVSIGQDSVIGYLQQQFGVSKELSEEQFSRGIVALRNEITKEVVRWLRSQKGIEANSDLVSVSFLPVAEPETESAEVTKNPLAKLNLTSIATIAGILILTFLLITGWKARSPRRSPSGNEQLSDGGRAFVTRNQINPGRELADEASEVVHSAPADSAKAFQNLVTGEAAR